MVWMRHIFYLVPVALRGGLPITLNLGGDVCMWAYQPSAVLGTLIPPPAEPARSPVKEPVRMHADNHICTCRWDQTQ